MPQIDTKRALTLLPGDVRSSLSFDRGAPRAAFLSQLIAERHHLATQRSKRQAPVAEALRTYDAGGKISIRRLPPGYRMTLDA